MRRSLLTRQQALAPWLFALVLAGGAPISTAIGETPEAEAVDYFRLDIPLIGGGELTSDDLRGEILVVDVWGTWCGPCRRVIPHLIQIQNDFSSRGVRVIGISAEPAESEEVATRKVLRYAAEMGINYSLGIFDPGLYDWIRTLMRFEGDAFTVPSTFVVDRDGAVIARYPGYFHGQEDEIRRLLNDRLEKTPPAGQASPAAGASPRR